MSTETTPDQLPPLPDPRKTKTPGTWHAPNILTESKDGVDSIRSGGSRQVEFITETWLSEEEQKPEKEPLQIRAKNSFNIGGATIDVLNDAGTFAGRGLQASTPTASEYLANVGSETIIQFSSTPVTKGNIFAALKRPAVFLNIKVSIIIP